MHPLAILATIFDGPDPLSATLGELDNWRASMAICFPDGWQPEADSVLTRAERLDRAAWLDAHGMHNEAERALVATERP